MPFLPGKNVYQKNSGQGNKKQDDGSGHKKIISVSSLNDPADSGNFRLRQVMKRWQKQSPFKKIFGNGVFLPGKLILVDWLEVDGKEKVSCFNTIFGQDGGNLFFYGLALSNNCWKPEIRLGICGWIYKSDFLARQIFLIPGENLSSFCDQFFKPPCLG